MNRLLSRVVGNWVKVREILRLEPHDTSTPEGKSRERYRRILLTGGSSAIVKLLTVGINLAIVPLTVHYLGPERYGLWMAISSVLALMGFADLGLGNGLLNAVAKAHGLNDRRGAQVAVASTFYILCAVALTLLILFLGSYPFISWKAVFNVKSALAIKESGPTMMVLVVTFLINMPLGIIQRIQSGYQEGYKFQVWLIVGSVLSFAGLLTCIYLKGGLVWLVIAYSGGQLLGTIFNGIYIFGGSRKYLFPRRKYFDLKSGKLLILSGFTFFLLGMFALLANSSDDIIIAQTLGPKAITGYEIVKKLFMFSMFTQHIIQPLWPAFGEALVSGDLDWARRTLRKALRLSMLAGAGIALPLLLFGKQIIGVWVDRAYIPGWALLIGFFFYIILNNYIGVISTLLNSSALVRKLLIPMALTAAVGVILKIVLARSFGVSGVIWATIISWSVFFAIPSYYLSVRLLYKKR